MVDTEAFWAATSSVYLLDDTLAMASAHFVTTLMKNHKIDILTSTARALLGVGKDVEHVEHVVFHAKEGTLTLKCLRCGESYSPTMPIPVRLLSALTDAFHTDHERCQEEDDE